MQVPNSQESLIIKGCFAIIPGFGETGKPYGKLIKTREMLQNIMPEETCNFEHFNPDFIAQKLGIYSVACTNTTLDICREFWQNKEKYTLAMAFVLSQSRTNLVLYEMLEQAIANCLATAQQNSNSHSLPQISAHIHIVTFVAPNIEYELAEIRRRLEISGQKPLTTIILQQGCAGLIVALKLAQVIVSSFQDIDKENVLITSENNMMIHAHQRFPFFRKNIDTWLWPAIFGEGVGAIIASGSSKDLCPGGIHWKVDKLSIEPITNCWHVSHQYHDEAPNYTTVYIRTREVPQTYLRGVEKNARIGIDYYNGLKNIFRICLHESNPLLLKQAAFNLHIPMDIIPSISAKTGTLACVSSFSLLHKVNEDLKKVIQNNSLLLTQKNKLVFSLVGEALGRIEAGHICLSLIQ